MLSKINQSQKHKYCIFYLYEESKIVKLREAENTMVVDGVRRLWGIAN